MITRKKVLDVFHNSGYKGEYVKFLNDKVIPTIGMLALQYDEGGHTITQKDADKILKSMVVIPGAKINSIKKLIAKAGPDETAKLLINLMGMDDEFPIKQRLKVHPISHNMLYDIKNNNFVRTKLYNKFRKDIFSQLEGLDNPGVDFASPLQVKYYFGHREKSGTGGVFDRSNFQKAAQDCIFEHFGFDDTKALVTSIDGEYVKSYDDGFIEFSIRNT